MYPSQTPPADAGAVLHVHDQAGLDAALAAARGGETILLAPGAYAGLSLTGRAFPETVTIASADPDDRATIDGRVALRSVANLRIEGLDIAGSAELSPGAARVSVDGARGLALVDLRVAGAIHGGEGPHPAASLAEDHELGQPCETGVRIRNSTDILVSDCEFETLYKAMTLTGVAGAVVSGSAFHDIRSDGIALSASASILIEGNVFRDFHPLRNPETGAGDHPDFIQFLGSAAGGVEGLTIRDNAFLQGAGGVVQAIFGHAGKTDAVFRDFEITGNVIQTNHSAGISLGDVIGARVSGNILIPSGQAMHAAETGWRPTIRLGGDGEAPRDVEITDNIATLSWNPDYDPTGFGAAENAARGIVHHGTIFLDQGKAVPSWWAEVAPPDPFAFAGMEEWREAVLAAIRAAAPPEVAERLPAPSPLPEPEPAGLRLLAAPGDARLEGGSGDDTLEGGAETRYLGGPGADRFVIADAGPGGGGALDLDFAAGDRLIFGAAEIDGLDDLLALALAGRLSISPEAGALRLHGEAGAGFDLHLAQPVLDRSGELPAWLETVAGRTPGLPAGLSGLAADAAGRLHPIESGALDAATAAMPGLHRLSVAAADGEGGFAFGDVRLLVRPDAPPTHLGGEGADTIRTAKAPAIVSAGAGDDAIWARAGADWIEGGAGADRIVGGAGDDTLLGGAGADKFRFLAKDLTPGARDLVADLDFAEGDSLVLTDFAAGSFEVSGWLLRHGGANTQIGSVEALAALDGRPGFALLRAEAGLFDLAIETGAGGEATISLALDDAEAARLDALLAPG